MVAVLMTTSLLGCSALQRVSQAALDVELYLLKARYPKIFDEDEIARRREKEEQQKNEEEVCKERWNTLRHLGDETWEPPIKVGDEESDPLNWGRGAGGL